MRCEGGPAHGRVVSVLFESAWTLEHGWRLRPMMPFHAVAGLPTRTSPRFDQSAEIKAEDCVKWYRYRLARWCIADRAWWVLEWPNFELSI